MILIFIIFSRSRFLHITRSSFILIFKSLTSFFISSYSENWKVDMDIIYSLGDNFAYRHAPPRDYEKFPLESQNMNAQGGL